jgi:hypothetical protein
MKASKIYKKQLIRIDNFKASVFPVLSARYPSKKESSSTIPRAEPRKIFKTLIKSGVNTGAFEDMKIELFLPNARTNQHSYR